MSLSRNFVDSCARDQARGEAAVAEVSREVAGAEARLQLLMLDVSCDKSVAAAVDRWRSYSLPCFGLFFPVTLI